MSLTCNNPRVAFSFPWQVRKHRLRGAKKLSVSSSFCTLLCQRAWPKFLRSGEQNGSSGWRGSLAGWVAGWVGRKMGQWMEDGTMKREHMLAIGICAGQTPAVLPDHPGELPGGLQEECEPRAPQAPSACWFGTNGCREHVLLDAWCFWQKEFGGENNLKSQTWKCVEVSWCGR